MRSPGTQFVNDGIRAVRRFLPMPLLLFLAFLPGSVAGDGGQAPSTGTGGVQVTRKVPFASETFEAVRAAAQATPARARGDRAIPRQRIDRSLPVGPYALTAAPLELAVTISAPSVAPLAPVLDSSFAGLGNPPPGQNLDVIPPDTMGAAGPNHLVSLLNSEFGVFDRNGTKLDNVSLQSFWASLGTDPGEPAHFPFDTKVLWDQHSGRFAAVTLGGTSAGSSWIMIAVSASTDALGAWNKWAIPSAQDNTAWADYPGFGLDASNVYVTANMFDNTGGYLHSKVWIIPKTQLLSGSTSITWTELRDPPGSGPSMQPAHTFGFGTPAAEYFLYEDQYINATSLLLAKIDNVAGTPVWHPPTRVTVSSYTIPTLQNPMPNAPQAGDNRTIDTSDTRLLNAVYRNGYLWTTHTVSRTVAGNERTEVAWYRIDPNTSAVSAQGRIRDTSRWYYYPSIAVNGNDVAAIGFSGSSTDEYVGGYYTILRPILQPPYYVSEPVALLKSGEAAYYKTLSKRDNRWGDFSATVVDPADDVTFWTLQEYAKVPVVDPRNSTLVSQWGTWWGKFHPSDVPAPTGLTATASDGPQVVLNWTDASVNETGFQVERRRLPGEDYAVIASLSPDVTSFTDNAATRLLDGFRYSYRVQAFNATGGAYSAEAFASLIAPPPPPSSGGGGGCLAIAPAVASPADASSVLSLLTLFLPVAVCGWKRRCRPRKCFGNDPFRHPVC